MGGRRAPQEHPLFVSESRRNLCEPLTFETWNKIVRAVALRTSLPEFTTHTFRHLQLTDLARSGLELHEIATYAGHRSLNTTMKYIHKTYQRRVPGMTKRRFSVGCAHYPRSEVISSLTGILV